MCGIVGFTGNQQVARFCWMVCLKWNIEDGNDNFQEQAGMVGLSIATLPEDYLTRIANGYIIGVHSCVEHFLVQYRLLPGSPARGQNYSAEDDDVLSVWTDQYARNGEGEE